MHELKALWTKLMGTPQPVDAQFAVWLELYGPEIVRLGIARTAAKNLTLAQGMDLDYRLRYASTVMRVQAERNADHAANRARLREEFDCLPTQIVPSDENFEEIK